MPKPVAAPAGQPASVKAVFEKYDLFGTFALNCGRPVGRDNQYYYHKPLDGGRVQREMMSGPAARDFLVVFERASQPRPNEIAVAGTRDGRPVESVYRVESMRARVLESTFAGRKEIAGGRFVNGGDTPWMNKCSAR